MLECAVVGKPTPNIKWFNASQEIKPDKKTKITFNPQTGVTTLELLEPLTEEAIISCIADNKFGKAECRTNITPSKAVRVTQPVVLVAPRITKPVEAVVSKPRKDLVLDVEFDGSPELETKWVRNNKVLQTDNNYTITTKDKKSKLVISKDAPQKSGKYEVRITNEKGETRSGGSVMITDDEEILSSQAPRFIKPIYPQIVTPGEVVVVEANVEASPTATFQWYQGSFPIQSSPDIRISTVENRSILVINDVDSDFAGLITCRAENAVGSVSCTATLDVVEEMDWQVTQEIEYPRFVQQITPQRVMDGEKVQFTCVVSGKPTPKVTWYHNNEVVQQAKDVLIMQDSEGVCSLAISEVFPENAGEYSCEVNNKVGKAICKSSLIVEGKYYNIYKIFNCVLNKLFLQHMNTFRTLR